jgi:hypothetical protein
MEYVTRRIHVCQYLVNNYFKERFCRHAIIKGKALK